MNCKEQSELEVHSVVLENRQNAGDVYPIVYGDNSKLTLSNLSVQTSEYRYQSLYFMNSQVVINNNSFLRECRVELNEKSQGTVSDTSMNFNSATSALVINNGSHCEISNLNLTAKYLEYSAVFVTKHSYLSMRNSTVQQKEGYFAVMLKDYSDMEMEYCDVSGVDAISSKVKLTDCTVRETISSENDSCVQIVDSVNLLGENPNTVDVYIDNHSVVYGEKVCTNRVINPNLKVVGKSVFNTQMLEYIGGDVKDLIIEVDGDSTFVCHSMHDIVEKGAAQKDMSADEVAPRVDSQNTRQALDNLIGLSSVKKEIDRMISMVNLNKKRMEMGLEPEPISLHSVFMGNPGTGKTTVARMIGEILWEAGAFKGDEFKFIEATEPDLVSSNVGQTAEKTFALLEKAKGGVLFIDEAYALYRGKDDSFGLEAIDTLVKAMEDHRDDLIVILAGYSKEMETFLNANSGLKSRFANIINFEDYTGHELVLIAKSIAASKDYRIDEEALKPLEDYFSKVQSRKDMTSGNGRLARNIVEEAILNQSKRVLEDDAEIDLLQLVDFDLKEGL